MRPKALVSFEGQDRDATEEEPQVRYFYVDFYCASLKL